MEAEGEKGREGRQWLDFRDCGVPVAAGLGKGRASSLDRCAMSALLAITYLALNCNCLMQIR